MIWGTLDPFVEDGPILGRKVANSTFLSALLKADPYEAYHFFLTGDGARAPLQSWIHEHFPALARRKDAIVIDSYLALGKRLAATRYHCMHLSDIFSRYTKLTQTRNACGANIFPVTGVTHSLSYTHFMPEYLKHLWPGVSPRDAVIVTSESARLAVQAIFNGLRQSYGMDAETFPAPKLVTIPLGIAAATLPSPEQHWTRGGMDNPGLAMRQRLNLGDAPIFLYFGRLCPSSKMDLMPLFAAFARAEALGLPPGGYSFVLAGWADDGDSLPEALCSFGRAKGIRTIAFPRPDDRERMGLFAAADVFVSPSDNIQETFGLSIAEAGAAGLPVVASDFDGYRDIVAHGESGLLIPTLGFAASNTVDADALWWYDNQYHLRLAQGSVVDVPAFASALASLGTDTKKRRKMGESGRCRVLRDFSWDAVIKRYVTLWDELAATPIGDAVRRRIRTSTHPLRMRFATYFKGHFTHILDKQTLEGMSVKRTATGEALYKGLLPTLSYTGMEHMLDETAVNRLLLTTRKTVPATHALEALQRYFEEKSGNSADNPRLPATDAAREQAEFTLLWCLKQDHLEIINTGAQETHT